MHVNTVSDAVGLDNVELRKSDMWPGSGCAAKSFALLWKSTERDVIQIVYVCVCVGYISLLTL